MICYKVTKGGYRYGLTMDSDMGFVVFWRAALNGTKGYYRHQYAINDTPLIGTVETKD